MRPLQRAATAFVVALSLVPMSCAGLRKADGRNPKNTAAVSRFSPLPKFPDFSLANLLPGSRVKVVEVREKDLKKLPSGRERALAYANKPKRGLWFFGGPVDFKEPTLPEPGSDLDGSLLPPRVP